MLSVVTGPFHPDLETALVSEVRSLKQENPLAPLALIVPSKQLARRVKWLLAVEQGLALLDVHVLTFHRLAETLIEEGRENQPAQVNGFFREELLRYLVDRGVPGADAFRDRRGMQGLWTGLWATVQDLKEARVEPTAVVQALDEGRLTSEDPARLAALVRLYAAVLEVYRALRLADPDDLAALAMPVRNAECAPRSMARPARSSGSASRSARSTSRTAAYRRTSAARRAGSSVLSRPSSSACNTADGSTRASLRSWTVAQRPVQSPCIPRRSRNASAPGTPRSTR